VDASGWCAVVETEVQLEEYRTRTIVARKDVVWYNYGGTTIKGGFVRGIPTPEWQASET
jgi:hypothetical protein